MAAFNTMKEMMLSQKVAVPVWSRSPMDRRPRRDVENNTGGVLIMVSEPSGDSGCGSCMVGTHDMGGSLLLSLGVLGVLLWLRRRSPGQ
jgi:MYXO-CTERM domain-containing protein